MSARLDAVEVYADLDHFADPKLMGVLRRQTGGRGDVFSFTYDSSWLRNGEALVLDPDLALVTGAQYPPADRANFGIFLDSSPDRWGRVLMQRRENARARHDGRKPKILGEWDFLLGVHDQARLGALRFRYPGGEHFIDTDNRLAAPPLTSLRALQTASLKFEQHLDEESHPQYERWLAQLFAPGSSLGGARPKASVTDEDGSLCIAKFPSRQDTRDVGAWEILAHRLATKVGITVPPTRAIRVSKDSYTTFLAKRFDRTANGRRRAFVSAMTLTQRKDGDAGASYLELVDLLQSRGANTRADCEQLFRRVVFNILIHNTDDHLRNHGFFVAQKGLLLSPAYDMNPTPDQQDLSLAINETETQCDADVAMQSSKDYGIAQNEAARILREVRDGVFTWRREATALDIPRQEQEAMSAAFPSLALTAV